MCLPVELDVSQRRVPAHTETEATWHSTVTIGGNGEQREEEKDRRESRCLSFHRNKYMSE